MTRSITIVGGGVAGLCVARTLLDRGATVTVVDRVDGIGDHACSWWAGGMLAPFCEGETAEEPVVRLGQEASDWWDKHTGVVTRNGSLVVALGRDQSDLRRFARRTTGHDTVGADDIATLEPDLGGRFQNGLYFPTESHLAPRAALNALRAGLVRDGVTFIIADATPEDIDGTVVDCRGFAARGDIPHLRGVKGEMAILRCPDVTLSRPVRLLHPRIPLYIVPRGDGVFMLGATMIESNNTAHVTARSLLELLSAAYAVNPAFGEAEVIEIGVDARPAFADNMPRIGRRGRVIYANGLYRHGFLLAPALGRMVGDYIFDEQPPEVFDEHSS